jgi:hypothetical protein
MAGESIMLLMVGRNKVHPLDFFYDNVQAMI